jgi:hypothetical protein
MLKKIKYGIILSTSCRVHDAVSQRLGIDGWSSRVQTRSLPCWILLWWLRDGAVPRNHAANQT